MSSIGFLFLMILLHIIDDFVLQPVCLSKLKQKKFWEPYVSENSKYKHDYWAALVIHGLSWSIMIHLPFLFTTHDELTLFGLVIGHAALHAIVDDEKANRGRINLIVDQTIHFLQIIFSWILLTI